MSQYPGRKFIIGRTFGHENNGTEFWSYYMLVAIKTDETIYITTEKRSPTTTRHCNYLKKMYPQYELVSQDELLKIATMRREIEWKRKDEQVVKAMVYHHSLAEGA